MSIIVIFLAVYFCVQNFLNRVKAYKNLVINKILQSFFILFFQLIFSFSRKIFLGLILGYVVGCVLTVVRLLLGNSHVKSQFSKLSLKKYFY